jgi:thioredoxin reductase
MGAARVASTMPPDADPAPWDVAIVGGGLAGLTAAIFTARADLDTLVLNHGAPIVTRNAHLENFPGFPAGVNPRLLVEMIEDQAERTGATLREAKVTRVGDDGDGFELATDDGTVLADRVLAASWKDASYLDPLGPRTREDGSKTYLQPDEAGRTDVDGLYAAGRLADRYHQAIVNAGDGAKVAIALIEDADPDFYHDWTVPEGYFTLRDREVPKGCEEVPKGERFERERESVATMQRYFRRPHEAPVDQHPSLKDDEDYDP